LDFFSKPVARKQQNVVFPGMRRRAARGRHAPCTSVPKTVLFSTVLHTQAAHDHAWGAWQPFPTPFLPFSSSFECSLL